MGSFAARQEYYPLSAEEKIAYIKRYCRELIPVTPAQIRGQLRQKEELILIVESEGRQKMQTVAGIAWENLTVKIVGYYAVQQGFQMKRLTATEPFEA